MECLGLKCTRSSGSAARVSLGKLSVSRGTKPLFRSMRRLPVFVREKLLRGRVSHSLWSLVPESPGKSMMEYRGPLQFFLKKPVLSSDGGLHLLQSTSRGNGGSYLRPR